MCHMNHEAARAIGVLRECLLVHFEFDRVVAALVVLLEDEFLHVGFFAALAAEADQFLCVGELLVEAI